MTTARLALACASTVLLLGSISGCGNSGISCDPECPKGSHCTDTGCVLDDGKVDVDLWTGRTDDGGTGCNCGGTTPYCVDGQCVACTSDSTCPSGQVCKKLGNIAACVPGCSDDARCKAGGNASAACCQGGCTDTSKDASNCGGCGNVCSAINAGSTCVNSVCVPGACNPGWGDCNKMSSDGCETNLHADAKNCAACGSVCTFDHAIAGCSDACYIAACQFGWDDCNAEEKDGCETSVLSDVQNCGGCGMPCANIPHAQSACVNAGCQLTQCEPGYTDCDGNPKNGCETVTDTDAKNCGACGNVCPQGLVCKNGGCTCQQCNIANAITKCVNNQCLFDRCMAGFTDCDGNPANGCEVATGTDPLNCGGCGTVCPNNLPGCQGGKCVNGWFPVGVQLNVPVNMLAGWSECFRDTFGDFGTPVATILKKCSGNKLMMACGKHGSNTLSVVAWAPRADVIFPTNGSGNCPDNNVHQANGVGWYYDSDWSWGFVKGGDTPENCNCDLGFANGQYRMCVSTFAGDFDIGYRCGNDDNLFDQSFDRVIYQF